MNEPLFTNDTIVFGILMLALGAIFYTESLKGGFWEKFYKIVPGLLIGALRFGNLPMLFIPGGPMKSGISNQEKAEINAISQMYGMRERGQYKS